MKSDYFFKVTSKVMHYVVFPFIDSSPVLMLRRIWSKSRGGVRADGYCVLD